MNSRKDQLNAFDRLLTIMDDLREQCPWDKKQTFESLRHLTIEETYELCDAILDKDLQEIKNELGDVLLHIIFYSKIGSETGDFDIADVANSICEKLISRHPHIYGDVIVKDEEDVKRNWENLKLKEGKITFQVINVDKAENEKLAEKFEASGTALFLNVIKEGKEIQFDLTEFAFMKGNEQEEFSKELKIKLENELKNL